MAKIQEPFVIARVFDAPRERMWKAWTDPVELKKWWGPAGAGRTKVTVRWLPHEASGEEAKAFDEGRKGMKQGWGGTMHQLAAYLE